MASEWDNPIQDKADAVQKEAQSANEKNVYPAFLSSVEVKFPRRVEENYNSNQQRQESRDKWKLRLEAAMVLVVSVSMMISLYMWNEMKKTTEATKLSADAAAASTTAWIAAEALTYKGIEQDRVVIDVILKNVGKTTAFDAGAGWEFTFLPGPELKQVPKYEAWQCPKPTTILGIVQPDRIWVTTIKSPQYSVAQLKMIADKTAKIFVHGCVKYRDVLTQNERATEFAGYYPAPLGPGDEGKGMGIYAPYSRMK